jgi:hypothetical protein
MELGDHLREAGYVVKTRTFCARVLYQRERAGQSKELARPHGSLSIACEKLQDTGSSPRTRTKTLGSQDVLTIHRELSRLGDNALARR